MYVYNVVRRMVATGKGFLGHEDAIQKIAKPSDQCSKRITGVQTRTFESSVPASVYHGEAVYSAASTPLRSRATVVEVLALHLGAKDGELDSRC
jgi:hypothetical protein